MKAHVVIVSFAAIVLPLPTLAADAERVISSEQLRRLNAEVVTTATRSADTRGNLTLRESALAVNPDRLASELSGTGRSNDIRIRPGEYVALKTADPVAQIDCRIADDGQCVQTQFRYLAFSTDGTELNLTLDVEAHPTLRYVPEEGRYRSSLFVKLSDSGDPATVRNIDGAIQVIVSAPVDEVDPGEILEIGQTNRFKTVKLAVRSPQEPTPVRLAPDREAEPHLLSLSVDRPALTISAPPSMLGFGLETATVTLNLPGIQVFPREAIVLSANGSLDATSVVLDDHGVATTTLRSRSVGQDVITAELSPFASGRHTIDYIMPWSWFIAVLIGSLIGVAIRITMRRKHPEMPGDWKFDVAIGLLGGLMTALLYALGVNIVGIPLPTGYSEILTLVLSALGGWVFPGWISALGTKKPG